MTICEPTWTLTSLTTFEVLICPAPGEDFFIALFLKIGKLGGSSSLLWEPKA